MRSEKAVEDGLDWLVRHQRPDGSWALNFHGQCQGAGCPEQFCLESETAATGLAHLAPARGWPYSYGQDALSGERPQRTGVAGRAPANQWRALHQRRWNRSYVQSCHRGDGPVRSLWDFRRAQAPPPGAAGLELHRLRAEFAGWRLALCSRASGRHLGLRLADVRLARARLAGLQVPRNVAKGCRLFLDLAAVDESRTMYAYQPGRGASPVMTAEALLTRQYLGWPRDFPP